MLLTSVRVLNDGAEFLNVHDHDVLKRVREYESDSRFGASNFAEDAVN